MDDQVLCEKDYMVWHSSTFTNVAMINIIIIVLVMCLATQADKEMDQNFTN